MDRVAISARARVDADLRALLVGEVRQHAVVELDEVRQQARTRPRVARILAGREAALREVDRDASGAGLEGLADVRHALLDDVLFELLARVAVDGVLQRVQQREHRRGDDGLLHRLGRVRQRLLERVGGVEVVLQRAARELGQLAAVTIGEDREELPARAEVRSQAGAGQRVGDRVRGEARPPLLAVGDDRLTRRLTALDGVLARRVLEGLEVVLGDVAGVVLGVCLLQLLWTGQGADGLRGNAGVGPRIVI